MFSTREYFFSPHQLVCNRVLRVGLSARAHFSRAGFFSMNIRSLLFSRSFPVLLLRPHTWLHNLHRNFCARRYVVAGRKPDQAAEGSPTESPSYQVWSKLHSSNVTKTPEPVHGWTLHHWQTRLFAGMYFTALDVLVDVASGQEGVLVDTQHSSRWHIGPERRRDLCRLARQSARTCIR